MSTSTVHKLAPTISAHAFNWDRTMVALCPNNNEVHIYRNCQDADQKNWERVDILKEHQMVVSAIDWSPVTNKIVTCSHDRNAFVWTYEEGDGEWKPSLVILRINRAALDVKWSPDGKKFAVSSGAKCVPVCHFDPTNDWWISKMIKKHKSTVLSIDWHPDSQLLLTGASDFKCRVFSAFIDDVDEATEGLFGELSSSFGDLLADFDNSLGWVECVSWSPSGQKLAFCGHDSSLTIVTFEDQGGEMVPTAQTLKLKTLPLRSVAFLTDGAVVGVGHERNPTLYTQTDDFWAEAGMVDKKGSGSAKKSASSFSAARNKWSNRSRTGQDSGAKDSNTVWTKHDNLIHTVCRHAAPGEATAAFSTSGLDGRIIIWNAADAGVPLPGL